MVLRCDPARALPALDPDGRQALIALGAFVELAVLAAPAAGRRAEVALHDDGEASIELLPDPAVRSDPLFAALPHRRTTRLAYDLEKPVAPPDAAALADAAGPAVGFGCVVEPGAVAALRSLTRTAHERAELLHAVAAEEASWLRLEGREDAAALDGIPVRGVEVRWAARLGLLSPARLADPASPAARMARLQWANLFAATASFGWLATQADRAVRPPRRRSRLPARRPRRRRAWARHPSGRRGVGRRGRARRRAGRAGAAPWRVASRPDPDAVPSRPSRTAATNPAPPGTVDCSTNINKARPFSTNNY